MIAYGKADQTFSAVGGEVGINRLVDCFYDIMSSDPAYATIWKWHPKDKADESTGQANKPKQLARDKLAAFLCGWMGGPRRYQERFGSINIPQAHAHLPVTEAERDMWLGCMRQALLCQSYPAELTEYLLRQLAVPAQRIFMTCQPES